MIQISTDKSKLQVEVIHHFLTASYWTKGMSNSIEIAMSMIWNLLYFIVKSIPI